jgi:hypothetical protein
MTPSVNYRPQSLLFGGLNRRINEAATERLRREANDVINGFKQHVGDKTDLSALHYALQSLDQFNTLPEDKFSSPVRQYVYQQQLSNAHHNGLSELGTEVRRQLLHLYQDASM